MDNRRCCFCSSPIVSSDTPAVPATDAVEEEEGSWFSSLSLSSPSPLVLLLVVAVAVVAVAVVLWDCLPLPLALLLALARGHLARRAAGGRNNDRRRACFNPPWR